MKPDYITVSFSGGKDSTAMLLHMIELGEHIDEVINIDTGMEFPAMYDHIDKVRQIVESHGIKYTTLRGEHTYEYYLLEIPIKSEKYGDHYGYGWTSVNCRWCTQLLKLKPLSDHQKELKEKYNIIQCIGLACDETKRLSRTNNTNKNHRHPLVEWGWSESDALEYCRSLGFDWGGLYDLFNRVSCWCCPLASISELRKLWKHYPDLWKQLEEWETMMRRPDTGKRGAYWFKDKTTVFDLAKRFQLEEERLKKGMKIDSPGFYMNLRRAVEPLPESQTFLTIEEGSE